MTGRAVPEWVADHPDQAVPTRVKLRIWERCGGRCALTGRKLRPGDKYEFDHIIALTLGGRHAELNLQVVSSAAHRVKSDDDMAIKSKIARTKAKHLGVYPPSPFKLKGRGFERRRTVP